MSALLDDLNADRAGLAEALAAVSAERDTLQAAMVAWPEATETDPLEGIEARTLDMSAALRLRPRDHDPYLVALPPFAEADVNGSMGEGELEARLRFRHLTYWHDYVWMLEVDGQRRIDAVDLEIEAAS